MGTINFVPDDYIKNADSQKTNLISLLILLVVMLLLGGAFMTIKIRQRSLEVREGVIDAKLETIKESILQFEQLQTKRQEMLKAALTTSDLLEPVPRSVLLALLTNNLPSGTSLLKLNLVQKKPKAVRVSRKTNTKYGKAKAKNTPQTNKPKISPEKLLETHIELEGIAKSDIQVASYIKQLSDSHLLENVALVESKEYKLENTIYRQFKLTAMLKKSIRLSKEDIGNIRSLHARVLKGF